MKCDTLECVIPFAGFYNSVHDEELDRAVDRMFSTDDSGDASPGLLDAFWRRHSCDWGAVHDAYAREYAETLADAIGAQWTYAALDSPREYNFTTDRIFVSVPVEEARRWLGETNDAPLREIARRRHMSRDGFISFYDPDPFTWGDVETWEPEQLHTLFIAWIESGPNDGADEYRESVETHGQGIAEFYLLESWQCNGGLDSAINAGLRPAGQRLTRIAYYLRQRRERSCRRAVE